MVVPQSWREFLTSPSFQFPTRYARSKESEHEPEHEFYIFTYVTVELKDVVAVQHF